MKERREIDEVFLKQEPMLDEVFLKQEPPTDPLEQYLLDEVFLKHNLPIEILGDPPPPKGDPEFELKPLPDNLKYVYLGEKKIYPVIISATLLEQE